MQKLASAIDRFCYKHNNWGIPGLMRYIVLVNVFVFLMDMFFSLFSSYLTFIPYMVFRQGQIWRLITFVLVPLHGYSNGLSILWFAITSLCYYHIGTALEQRWGTARFTIFYGLGVLLNLVGGLLISAFSLTGIIHEAYFYSVVTSMYYVNLSLFFSIASLYPNLQFYLYFIIPVKAKWMGWFSGALFAIDIVQNLLNGQFALAFIPLLAIFNYFLFFWEEISLFLFKGKHRVTHSQAGKVINLKTAQKEVQQRKGYLHKCTVCGVTDADKPDMDFRYCSKCQGYHCYCMDHINDHVHKE